MVARQSLTPLVLTSGCFDLVHGEHLTYLCRAAEYGRLVVGVNSDASVKRLKGPERPIRGEADRAYLLAGFGMVALTAVFDDDLDLIRAVRPDVYVASTTSRVLVNEDLPRVALLREIGCRIVELGSTANESTTDMIARMARVG